MTLLLLFRQAKGSSSSPVYNSASDQELRELDPKLDENLRDSDSGNDAINFLIFFKSKTDRF
jgi:hypothetical protein